MYGFELDKTVTIRRVEEVLTRLLRHYGPDGTHEIYLGDLGTHTIDCAEATQGDITGFVEDALKELAS